MKGIILAIFDDPYSRMIDGFLKNKSYNALGIYQDQKISLFNYYDNYAHHFSFKKLEDLLSFIYIKKICFLPLEISFEETFMKIIQENRKKISRKQEIFVNLFQGKYWTVTGYSLINRLLSFYDSKVIIHNEKISDTVLLKPETFEAYCCDKNFSKEERQEAFKIKDLDILISYYKDFLFNNEEIFSLDK